ncbi:MAG: MFS transporter [Pyrinomonadaceae bacterium]
MNTTQKNEFREYGWLIVCISTLALVVSNGLAILGLPVFYKPMLADLIASGSIDESTSQTLIGTAAGITLLSAGLLAPIGGWLYRKTSARLMMTIGSVLLGGGILLYSRATGAWSVYGAHALLGLSLVFVGVLVNTVLISEWFVEKRGVALGIVLTGTSFGGVLIPPIATPLIGAYGWRTAMLLVSLLVWLVLLPAVVLLVKNKRREVNAESALAESIPEENATTGHQDSTGEAIGSLNFWVLGLASALIFYTIFIVSQQLNLYLQTPAMGYTLAEAGAVQSRLFMASVAGKFLFGWLSDRFSSGRVMIAGTALMLFAASVFPVLTPSTILLFAIPFGLSYGGVFVLIQLQAADLFGRKNLALVLGIITAIETIGGAAGTRIAGMIADANGGDYRYAFLTLIPAMLVTVLLAIVLNRRVAKSRVPSSKF